MRPAALHGPRKDIVMRCGLLLFGGRNCDRVCNSRQNEVDFVDECLCQEPGLGRFAQDTKGFEPENRLAQLAEKLRRSSVAYALSAQQRVVRRQKGAIDTD